MFNIFGKDCFKRIMYIPCLLIIPFVMFYIDDTPSPYDGKTTDFLLISVHLLRVIYYLCKFSTCCRTLRANCVILRIT